MKSKTQILFGFFWICCVVHIDLSAQTVVAQPQYRFQHFDVNDGLPSHYVMSIAEDSLGFIWFSDFGGLTRFDGYTFKVYKHDPSNLTRSLPKGQIVNRIQSDHNGNIWVTSRGHDHKLRLSRYDRKSDSFLTYEPGIDAKMYSLSLDKDDQTIWLCTRDKGLFRFNIKTHETRSFFNDHPDSLKREMRNRMWGMSNQDSCIIIGTSEGLWRFDKKTKSFSRPSCNPADSSALYNTWVVLLDDRQTENDNVVCLWLGATGKMVIADENLSIVNRFDLPASFFMSNSKFDDEGRLWIASASNGLYRYDPADGSFINLRNIPGEANSLKTNSLSWVMVDKYQNIWLASEAGVSKIPKQRLQIYNFKLRESIDESMVYRNTNGDFLMISQHKNDTVKISVAALTPNRLDKLQFETVKKLHSVYARIGVSGLWKGKNNFWIGLGSLGVAKLAINPLGMPRPDDVQILRPEPGNPNALSSNYVNFVWEDPNDNLWLGMYNGLSKVNLTIPYGSEGSVTRYEHSEENANTLDNDFVWNICPENDTSFWVVTDSGVGLFQNEKVQRTFRDIRNPSYVHKSSDNSVLIAGIDGLYEATRENGQYKLTAKPLLNIDYVVRIQEDDLRRLWISTAHGIYFYDRKTNVVVEFNERDGFDHTPALNSSYREYKTSKGLIVTSDAKGISIFDPLSLKLSEEKTFPILTSLEVNNKLTRVEGIGNNSEEFAIKRNINVLDELVLDYQHNNFTVGFSALEMTDPERNLFRHKLDGFEGDWIETDSKNRTATYTNLDPGKYIFKVKASNHHGIWSDQETLLNVHILPPPWKTWWAYTLYILVIVGIFLYWRRYEIRRLKLKHRAEHLSELDHLKTRFFTNISHEFRTPISLILGPLKEMYNKANNDQSRSGIGIMLRNAHRLSRLINQLLDLSKLEAQKMRLLASPVELVEFIRDIGSSYESLATTKKIKYLFYAEVAQLTVYIDSDKIEKILHNLLSNAFKFTKEGGQVILNLKADQKHCRIIVKDTGIGIPADQLEKIFDRFYQVDNSQTREYEGTGLGMSLTKELVDLHHGTITIESAEGKGTVFTVRLSLGRDHFGHDEIVNKPNLTTSKINSEELSIVEESNKLENENVIENIHQPVLLIVDDNSDMRHYLRKSLIGQYQILEAATGKQGLTKAQEIIPDLIISDVMMPELDGYKFCEFIKTNELTSHIPVILLTARADRESKLSGLAIGADDYLPKPFDVDELRLIVRNRLEERRKVRERFSREVTLEPKHIAITSFDEKFLNKVLNVIENHMDDADFSIEELSREVACSHMQLYRKLKGLAGQTPSQFLRTIRLKRAADLLRAKSDNVTQIAYTVGFNSPSYFNKCFKEQFGCTPVQFSKKNPVENN
jgi:signal transduction histidine kinase/DNA-binding response OmpR family regulator/ligand-binding sensor domain-containing protein